MLEVFNVLLTHALLQASQTKGVFDILMGGAEKSSKSSFQHPKEKQSNHTTKIFLLNEDTTLYRTPVEEGN